MFHKRHRRVLIHGILLVLFVIGGIAVTRLFLQRVGTLGWTPAAFFLLLLLFTAVALAWRTALDLKKAVRRL